MLARKREFSVSRVWAFPRAFGLDIRGFTLFISQQREIEQKLKSCARHGFRVKQMKLILTTLLLFLISVTSDAQYVSNLKMTYEGKFTTQDGKDHDVAVFDGKDATELFEMVKKHVALAFRSPKDVESNVNDKVISIYGYAPDCAKFTYGYTFHLSFHYSLKFQFKDSKIRIEVPVLYEMEGSYCSTLRETFKAAHIFNKNGVLTEKPKKRQVVIMLEDYFNDLINRIINGDAKAQEDW